MAKKNILKTTLSHNGIEIPITIKKSHLSKKIRLKPCLKTGGGNITIPKRLPYSQGKIFAKKHLFWLYTLISKIDRITINNLQQINFLGKTYQIKRYNYPKKYTKIYFDNNSLIIMFNIASYSSINKAFKKFIIKQAKIYFINQVTIKTAILDKKYNKVIIKDSIRKWGSCSNLRNLTFNWRLAFAPKKVIDYIISHEVAHLVHFNHSIDFWNLVKKLHPDYKKHKIWLKEHGHTLYNIII